MPAALTRRTLLRRTAPRLTLPLVAALTLAGCSDQNWRTTDVSEIMPPLDFSLVDEHGETVHAEVAELAQRLVEAAEILRLAGDDAGRNGRAALAFRRAAIADMSDCERQVAARGWFRGLP